MFFFSNKSKPSNHAEDVIYPDQILMGDDQKEDTEQKTYTPPPSSSLWKLRLLCGQAVLFTGLLSRFLLIVSLIMTLFAALTLFSVGEVNRLFRTFWGFYRSTVILTVTSFVGMFFPRFALSIIGFYLLSIAGKEYADFLAGIAPGGGGGWGRG